MRLALRSGLIEPGELADVRAATRDAFKQVAERSGVPPPVLDDLLWELGRDDPDLVGTEARRPARAAARSGLPLVLSERGYQMISGGFFAYPKNHTQSATTAMIMPA